MKKQGLFLLFLLLQCSLARAGEEVVAPDYAYETLSAEQQEEFAKIMGAFTQDSNTGQPLFWHMLSDVDTSAGRVTLSDDSVWQIGWWYRNRIKGWNTGERLKIYYHSDQANFAEIVNFDAEASREPAWATMQRPPRGEGLDYVVRVFSVEKAAKRFHRLILHSGLVFQRVEEQAAEEPWQIFDNVFVFHSKTAGLYDLWNNTAGRVDKNWRLMGKEQPREPNPETDEERVGFDILSLEAKLNQRVLAQPEATKTVVGSLLNHCSGFKDPKTPIGVFLFLGPTGVGKTELAKVLSEELYKGDDRLIRFDMSHFSDQHSTSRLIGSPPGYVNHDEGGQLTEALKRQPRSVVLFDEIEKAHQAVHKVFLPLFDEGYLTDAKNCKVLCNHTLFIMTSNLCAQRIAKLFNAGYTSQEVMEKIEPTLMEVLSPEFYNRLEVVLFRPLSAETLTSLVDLMLQEVAEKLYAIRQIQLRFDHSVRQYLIQNGYHSELGARPLKKLIQNKVMATLSYALIKQKIPDGSTVMLAYSALDDAWRVTWLARQEEEAENF